MKIVLIGSGKVATHMASAFKSSGNEIVEIYSRTVENAKQLATRVGAIAVNEIENLNKNADLYVFSIIDDALPQIIDQMPETTGIWVHTAGSVPLDVFSLKRNNNRYGVIYPLQTFSLTRELNFSKISLFIEGDTTETAQELVQIAETISEDVRELSSESRKYLHLSAVFANNFSNHMFTLSNEMLKKIDIPFDVLKPLIAETAAKIMEMDPVKAQTGPAIRLDERVINKHLELIEDEQMKNIYSLLSKSINRFSN